MSITFYPHNDRTYHVALAMLHQTGKTAVIHPAGTGKSHIGFQLCEDFPEKHSVLSQWTLSEGPVSTERQDCLDLLATSKVLSLGGFCRKCYTARPGGVTGRYYF